MGFSEGEQLRMMKENDELKAKNKDLTFKLSTLFSTIAILLEIARKS